MAQIILPGHGPLLHSAVSVEAPEQSPPPLLGGGFVQLLVLNFVPVPHVTLHVPYALQDDHLPAIADAASGNFTSYNIYLC